MKMKTQLRYELDNNRILKNKISQLKKEGRKLLLLYHTHFKGLDADDDDQIKEEKNASKKEVKASTSFQSEKEESSNKAEAASSPPKVSKETQVKRIAPAEKVSVIGCPELQTGVLNKTNNNLPPIKKRKEPEDPQTPDGPLQKVHCLTPSRPKEKILDDKFYITPADAAYQVAIFASTAETKRVNEDCSYNWPCLTIQKWKRGSAKTYDCQIPLKYLPACQQALRKIYEINESHFSERIGRRVFPLCLHSAKHTPLPILYGHSLL